jgi:hypothetical protein
LSSLVFWVIVIAVGWAVFRVRGGIRIYGPTLVLRRFDLQESPRDGVFIRIAGRPSGIIYWLMTVLRLSEETSLEVRGDRFSLRSASLRGQAHDVVPLTSIASTSCAYTRPIWCLFVAGAALLSGIVGGLGTFGAFFGAAFEGGSAAERAAGAFGGFALAVIGAAIFSAIFLVTYWLSRKLLLAVETNGARVVGVIFKPSVIENVSVDIHRAMQAVELLNRKVLESRGAPLPEPAGRPSPATVPSRPTPPPPPPTQPSMQCGACGATLTPGDRFCGECGTTAS